MDDEFQPELAKRYLTTGVRGDWYMSPKDMSPKPISPKENSMKSMSSNPLARIQKSSSEWLLSFMSSLHFPQFFGLMGFGLMSFGQTSRTGVRVVLKNF